MMKILTTCDDDVRQYRYNYIDEISKYLDSTEDMESHILKEIEEIDNSQFTRKCDSCAMLHLPRKQKCVCGGRVSAIDKNAKDKGDTEECGINRLPKYFSIGQVLNMNTSEISLNELVMKNPNSVESLKYILATVDPREQEVGLCWC